MNKLFGLLLLMPTLVLSGQLNHKITVSAYMPKTAVIDNVTVVNNEVVINLITNGSSSEVVFSVKKETDNTVSLQF